MFTVSKFSLWKIWIYKVFLYNDTRKLYIYKIRTNKKDKNIYIYIYKRRR